MAADRPGTNGETGAAIPAATARWRRNALVAAGRFAVAAVLALVVTRYALTTLGAAQFGVWALAGALLPMLRLLDLGVARSLTRSVAAADGSGDLRTALPDLAAGRAVLLLLGIAGLAGTWLLAGAFTRLAGVPLDLMSVASYALVGTAAVVLVENTFLPGQAALEGIGRMDLASGVDTAQRVASALGVVLVLALGWGIPGLVWKNIATALGAGIGYRLLLRRQAPALAGIPWRPDSTAARRLLAYGRHVQTVNLASLAVEPLAKTLLSRGWGLDAVTQLDLALRVTGQVGGGFLAYATAIFPAAAATQAHSDLTRADLRFDAALAALYRDAARAVTRLALPTFGLLAILAGPFVVLWLGPGYGAVAGVITIQSLGWLVAALGLPAFLIAQGGGLPRLATAAGLTTGGVSLVLCVLLIPWAGLLGAAVAMSGGLAAGGLVALVLLRRQFAAAVPQGSNP